MEVAGIVLGIIAISLTLYFRKDQKLTNDLTEGDIEAARHAYKALMEDFTNYQLDQARFDREETAKREIRFDNISKSIKKNESTISLNKKNLPNTIRETIKHIEFARPLDNTFDKK